MKYVQLSIKYTSTTRKMTQCQNFQWFLLQMQTNTCTVRWRIYPVLYYFLSTLHLNICTSPCKLDRKKEWDQAWNLTVEAAAQDNREKEACQEEKWWRSTVEKEAAALIGIWCGSRKDSLTERHGKDETPGDKENGIKDRSKIFKYQKLRRGSGRKGNKGTGYVSTPPTNQEYSLSSLPASSEAPMVVIAWTAVSASEGQRGDHQAAGAKTEIGWKCKGSAF